MRRDREIAIFAVVDEVSGPAVIPSKVRFGRASLHRKRERVDSYALSDPGLNLLTPGIVEIPNLWE